MLNSAISWKSNQKSVSKNPNIWTLVDNKITRATTTNQPSHKSQSKLNINLVSSNLNLLLDFGCSKITRATTNYPQLENVPLRYPRSKNPKIWTFVKSKAKTWKPFVQNLCWFPSKPFFGTPCKNWFTRSLT